MADRRLEQLLIGIAQQNAPQALMTWNRQGNEQQQLASLARQLANYNLLVILGDFPQSLQTLTQDIGTQIQGWVDAYGQMYHLLAGELFPSFVQLSAHYADDKWPVLIYMKGAATPVIRQLAGYVSPFIVRRQLDPVVSEVELLGIMDLILDELEASTLPLDRFKRVRGEGIAILKRLLASPIRQLPLTDFDQVIFTDSQRIILPAPPPAKPPEPPSLPELPDDNQVTQVDVHAQPADQLAFNPQRQPKAPAQQPGASEQTPETSASPKPPPSSVPIFFKRGHKRRDER
jgi:hypothetical protein